MGAGRHRANYGAFRRRVGSASFVTLEATGLPAEALTTRSICRTSERRGARGLRSITVVHPSLPFPGGDPHGRELRFDVRRNRQVVATDDGPSVHARLPGI